MRQAHIVHQIIQAPLEETYTLQIIQQQMLLEILLQHLSKHILHSLEEIHKIRLEMKIHLLVQEIFGISQKEEQPHLLQEEDLEIPTEREDRISYSKYYKPAYILQQ